MQTVKKNCVFHSVKRCVTIQKHQNSTIPSVYRQQKKYLSLSEGQFQFCVETWNQTEIYQTFSFHLKNVKS